MTNQLPAYLQQRQSKGLAQDLIANLGTGSPPYVSIANNRFTLIDSAGAEEPVATYDPKTGPYLDCVVVDSNEHMSKVFYDKAFDPNANQYEPPACFSDNGIGPSRSASKPQSTTCAACPNAVWGSKVSAVSGKGLKACHDTQKLAIMIPGDDVVFLLRVPPNSLSNLRGYTSKFVGQQIDISDVVTRISFVSQGTLQFAATSYIDEATYKRREAIATSHGTDVLVGRTDMPRTDALPASAAPAQLTAPEQQVQQPSPFVSAPAATAAAQPSQINTAPVSSALGAAAPTEPATRKRRQRNTSPAADPAPAANTAPAMAPFRPQAEQAAAQAAQPANFGIQQPAEAPSEVNNMLDSLFGPAGQ